MGAHDLFSYDRFKPTTERPSSSITREDKIAFLEMVKEAVSSDLQFNIDVSPNQVRAGKECSKTRTFVQYVLVLAFGGPPTPLALSALKTKEEALKKAKAEEIAIICGEFSFTIADVDSSEDNIKQTKLMVYSMIQKAEKKVPDRNLKKIADNLVRANG